MTQLDHPGALPASYTPGPATTNLADILERVLDKGIVIAGDIKIDLLDIELLTIRLRLFVSSVETARRAGIDWWETDTALSSRAAENALAEENRQLREQLAALERGELDGPEGPDGSDGGGRRPRDARRGGRGGTGGGGTGGRGTGRGGTGGRGNRTGDGEGR